MMLYLGPERRWVFAGRPGRRARDAAHGASQGFAELTEEAILAKARLADRFIVAADGDAAPDRRLLAESARRRRGCSARKSGDHSAGDPARRAKMQLEGPLPTDTLMVHAPQRTLDAVVAMYHDQGHIALKCWDAPGVNVTLGCRSCARAWPTYGLRIAGKAGRKPAA